ncbi:MAG: DNA mismatch repair protein MutS [Planctomycetes bacterium]|nr:DNA mismatch repair protein MutS [Planctomycetota bacterium]
MPAGSPTPMMQQYHEAKRMAGEALLLFRMGDFYELFFDDAKTAARVLGLSLTSRDKGEDPVPMAGFPHHQLDSYLAKIIATGHRAAVCEQVEDPKLAKGLVKREVTRIVTPGTVTDDALLDPQASNYLAAVTPPVAGVCDPGRKSTATTGVTDPSHSSKPAARRVGLAWVDVSTGRFYAAAFDEWQLPDQLARIEPAEILISDESPSLSNDLAGGAAITRRQAWTFGRTAAIESLAKHFGTRSLDGFGFDAERAADVAAMRAAGAILNYLAETQKASLAHIDRLNAYSCDERLAIDPATRRSLELLATIRDGRRDGSLIGTLDRTVTGLGARLLADWMAAPLTDVAAINARLDAADELVNDASLTAQIRECLRQIYDIQRLLARVTTGRASPRDLSFVGRTLACLPKVKAKLMGRASSLLQQIEQRLDLCADVRGPLEQALVDDCPLTTRDGGFIRAGFRSDLDELRELMAGGKQWMAEYQAAECKRTGIASIKVGFNSVFGYYLEVTHTHRDKVPAEYIRKQTLKNAERYATPELKEYEEKVLSAEEKAKQLEYDVFAQLRELVAAAAGRLQATAGALAEIDVLAALAELARSRNYVRPDVVAEPVLDIEAGRHPVLDITEPEGSFVPNSVCCAAGCGNDEARITIDECQCSADSSFVIRHSSFGSFLLITGPNMAGKSTYIRQAALLTLMAQMGSFVPARRAVIGVADRIFARVGASDELSRGQSTFMVEMTETARILNTATPRSLVILDEIGRGTSTYDGLSLAWSIVEHIHNAVGCRTLFATHYHELTDLEEQLPGVRNYNVAVKEWDDQVVFLHQIVPGAADKSYGIHVAQLAGVPRSVNDRAREVLAWLEAQHNSSHAAACGSAKASISSLPSTNGQAVRPNGQWQMTLFGVEEHPLLDEIRAANLDDMRPLEAMELLHSWQQRLADESSSK